VGQRWSYQLTPDGPDATVVTEIYDCSRAPEEERAGMDNGNVWAGAMAETLERLDALCTARKPARSVVGLAGRGSRPWAEELPAVAAAEQEDEPLQVAARSSLQNDINDEREARYG
jgi:hypothetical protein